MSDHAKQMAAKDRDLSSASKPSRPSGRGPGKIFVSGLRGGLGDPLQPPAHDDGRKAAIPSFTRAEHAQKQRPHRGLPVTINMPCQTWVKRH